MSDSNLFHNGAHLLTLAFSALIGFSTLIVFFLLKCYWWIPRSITRKLRQQGILVLPYHPLMGDAKEIKRLESQAKLSDMDSPSNHNLVPRLLPFYTKILSSESAGEPFVYWWGTQPRLLVTKPEAVKDILSADVKHYTKSSASVTAFHGLFGGGLLLAVGEDWRNQRNILRPAFFTDKLKRMVVDMSASALEMAVSWENIVKAAGPDSAAEVEVAHYLKNATADILARTSFGSSYQDGKAVFEKQELLLHLLVENRVQNSLVPGIRFLPTPSNLRAWMLEKSIDKDLRQIVESRRKSVPKGTAAPAGDLLGFILADDQQENKKSNTRLTTEQIMDECKTFFFAGHETTANLLAWTMMLLALHPEWQEQARAEVLEVCGKEAVPRVEHLNKMKIMGMILDESLRLYPPVPEIGPRVAAPHEGNIKVGGLSGLPQGMAFAIPTLLLHRDKDLWGKDADEFRPERFTDGASKACKHQFGFLPFGGGPRTCIGQTFAIMEAKVTMATILQRFRFRLSPNYKHAPVTEITMRPRYGMQLMLQFA